MKIEEFPDFIANISATSEVYRTVLSEAALKIYWECLRDYSLEQIKLAIKKHLTCATNGEFMPKPKDIIYQIKGSNFDRSDVFSLRASQAWGLVLRCFSSSFGLLEFEDKIIHRVVKDLGGLSAIGRCNEQNLPFLKNQFEKSYVQYAKQGIFNGDEVLRDNDKYNFSKKIYIENPPDYAKIDVNKLISIEHKSSNEGGYVDKNSKKELEFIGKKT